MAIDLPEIYEDISENIDCLICGEVGGSRYKFIAKEPVTKEGSDISDLNVLDQCIRALFSANNDSTPVFSESSYCDPCTQQLLSACKITANILALQKQLEDITGFCKDKLIACFRHSKEDSFYLERRRRICIDIFGLDGSVLSPVKRSPVITTADTVMIKRDETYSHYLGKLDDEVEVHHETEDTAADWLLDSEAVYSDEETDLKASEKIAVLKAKYNLKDCSVVLERVKGSPVSLSLSRKNCFICGHAFGSKEEMDLHRKIHKEEIFYCFTCNHSYATKEEIVDHIAGNNPQHQPGGSWVSYCKFQQCQKGFFDEEERINHVAACHSGEGFCCRRCGRDCQTLKQQEHHEKSHDYQQPTTLSCRYCEEQVESRKQLRLHMRAQHSGLVCAQCDLTFTTLKLYRAHLRTVHLKIKAHMCDTCGKRFNRPYLLRDHKTFAHQDPGEDPTSSERAKSKRVWKFMCNICSMAFPKQERLDQHLQFHEGALTKVNCRLCNQLFDTEDHLKAHKKQAHSNTTCETCGKAFGSKKKCRDHFVEVHLRLNAYMCHICGKRYNRRRELVLHLPIHPELNLGQPICKFCNKLYKNKVILENHIKTVHTKEWRFRCDQCDFGCLSQFSLDKHKLKHDERKHYKCSECGQEFKHKVSMDKHYRVKHGPEEGKCKCRYCDMVFAEDFGRSRHEKVKHKPERPFVCLECGKSFPIEGYLTRHIRKWHQTTSTSTQAPVEQILQS